MRRSLLIVAGGVLLGLFVAWAVMNSVPPNQKLEGVQPGNSAYQGSGRATTPGADPGIR